MIGKAAISAGFLCGTLFLAGCAASPQQGGQQQAQSGTEQFCVAQTQTGSRMTRARCNQPGQRPAASQEGAEAAQEFIDQWRRLNHPRDLAPDDAGM